MGLPLPSQKLSLPNVERILRSPSHQWPPIEFLTDGDIDIVLRRHTNPSGTFSWHIINTHISHKGIECTKHRPTRAQSFRRVAPLSLKVRQVSQEELSNAHQNRRCHSRSWVPETPSPFLAYPRSIYDSVPSRSNCRPTISPLCGQRLQKLNV